MRLMSPYSVKLTKNRNTTTIKTKNHFSYNNLTTNTKKRKRSTDNATHESFFEA